VSAEQVPLFQLLQEVALRTGMEVRGLEGLREKVSVHFVHLSLHAGLQQLLVGMNYLLLERKIPQGGIQPTLALVFRRGGTTPYLEVISSQARAVAENALEVEEERLVALRELARQGNETALQKAVFDPDPTIQEAAFTLLAERNRQGAVTLLVNTAKSGTPQEQLHALQLLHHTDQAEERTILSILGGAVTGKDIAVKNYAIQALAERGGPDAIGYLRQAIHDPDPSIRVMVLENAIQLVPHEQSLPLLQEALSDDDARVSATATSWLEEVFGETNFP